MLRRHSMGGLTLLLGLTAAPATAAELIGVVVANNKPVPDRTVCLVGRNATGTGAVTKSGNDGWFAFKNVPVTGSSAEFFLSCPATPSKCTSNATTTKQLVRLGSGTNNINCRP